MAKVKKRTAVKRPPPPVYIDTNNKFETIYMYESPKLDETQKKSKVIAHVTSSLQAKQSLIADQALYNRHVLFVQPSGDKKIHVNKVKKVLDADIALRKLRIKMFNARKRYEDMRDELTNQYLKRAQLLAKPYNGIDIG